MKRKSIILSLVILLVAMLLNPIDIYADECSDCFAAGTPCGRCGYSCSTTPEGGCENRDARDIRNGNFCTDWPWKNIGRRGKGATMFLKNMCRRWRNFREENGGK